MTLQALDMAFAAYLMCSLVHAGLLVFLARRSRQLKPASAPRRAMLAALALTGLWALLGAANAVMHEIALARTGALVDIARYAAWVMFLLALYPPASERVTPGGADRLRPLAAAALGLATLAQIAAPVAAPADAVTWYAGLVRLALPVLGLLMVEQVFRNAPEDALWNVKPVCLGLGTVFAFDVYLFAEALMFSRLDADVLNARPAVHALAVPFLVVAANRSGDWLRRLEISRTAAFYSATLVLIGLYLLFVAAVGYYIRYFGGTWGRAAQASLFMGALTLLAALWLSGSVRSRLRVFIAKHFFRYRYDYREEWLKFTALLSARRSPGETGEQIVRGLAAMVECPSASLWALSSEGKRFEQTTRWNCPPVVMPEAGDSPFCHFLRCTGWVVDLEEFRAAPRRYADLTLPSWLLVQPGAWLVVPLLAGEELCGFVVLGRPLTRITLNWEVLDLLKTAGRQAAAYLAQMQATEALLEARKFDAFNRMSAFVVHDLKNIVTQLSLMLKNAERHRDNPEFQQDMLITVASALERMKRMMLQLREGSQHTAGARGVALAPLAARLARLAESQGRKLDVACVDAALATRGHEDRLERVLGHLVQNALDATPAHGRVWLEVSRYSGQVSVEVGDTGAGMSEEFVRTRLFKPFSSSKSTGMGIGSYESVQYVRELGGQVTVESELGVGTVVTVLLPLLDLDRPSNLMMLDQTP
jgi:putative PEP-CTERM system histidine kinase